MADTSRLLELVRLRAGSGARGIRTGKSALPHPGLFSAIFIFEALHHYFYSLAFLLNN
jgi:hypothetical protein